jgi:hypothetical protein
VICPTLPASLYTYAKTEGCNGPSPRKLTQKNFFRVTGEGLLCLSPHHTPVSVALTSSLYSHLPSTVRLSSLLTDICTFKLGISYLVGKITTMPVNMINRDINWPNTWETRPPTAHSDSVHAECGGVSLSTPIVDHPTDFNYIYA